MSASDDLSFSEMLDTLAEWAGQEVGFAVFGSEGPQPIGGAIGRLGHVEMVGASDAEREWSVAKYRVGGHALFVLDQTSFVGARDYGFLRIQFGESILQIESPPVAAVSPEEVGQAGEGPPSYPAPRYSFLAMELNRLIDYGISIPIEEIRERIADRSLFDRLEQYRVEPYCLDLSLYNDAGVREIVLQTFEALDNADIGHAYGVQREGLALCLAYCVEVLGSPESYREQN